MDHVTRILLVHAYYASMAPIMAAFKSDWPEAQTLNILDEALYADVAPDGVMTPDVPARVESILRHAEKSRANGVVFTGSTFGPAVDAAKGIGIPVLKADEAMAEIIAAKAARVLVVCTARRAIPVIEANIRAKAATLNTTPAIASLWVEGAKDAISAGDHATHDRLIAEAVKAGAANHDVIAFGQISMVPARRLLPAQIDARVMSSCDASVTRMRELVAS
jgi:hypothetical protein